ncbi:MAG: YafY family protein [Clostridiales bacterium]|nr:YafY family protein [Clostridiales bacterium]
MKIDRLIGIITILLQNGKTTAPYLAKRFEVSRRTILRDIDTLCQAGIPIVTARGGDGGISIMDGYKLDKCVLTTDEMQSIITGLKSIDSISKTSNLERLLLKLSPSNAVVSLTDSIVIDLSSHYKDSLSEKISLIKQAIADGKLITFDYYYSKGETKRKIEPYFIAFKWAAWYVFGWCTEREDFRLFKLNRLWDLKITDESYAPRDIPSEKANLDKAHTDQNKIEILFDKSVRFRLIEDYGLHCYTETENGLLLSLEYTNKEYILSWILAFGDKAEVLSPQDVRNEYAEMIKNVAKKYKCT